MLQKKTNVTFPYCTKTIIIHIISKLLIATFQMLAVNHTLTYLCTKFNNSIDSAIPAYQIRSTILALYKFV